MDEEIVRITIRMPKSLHAEADELAKAQDRSLNGQLVQLLRLGLAVAAKANKDKPNEIEQE